MVKILSIDGGGIRGILPAIWLAEIEDRTGKPAVELFDFFAGTSTGGILALGLNIPDSKNSSKPKYSAKELVDLYITQGEKIFPSWLLGGIWSTTGNALHPKYPLKGLEQVLETYFGETLLSESLKETLITSYDLHYRRPKIFLSSQAKANSNEDFYMRLIARATSAAPTYFEPLKLQTKQSDYCTLVDGGVVANNPALYAYVEALKMNEQTNDCVLVSLGTGSTSRSIPYKKARKWGFGDWARPIIDVLFDGSSDAINYQLQQLIAEDKYWRFQPDLIEADERLDNATERNMELLRRRAQILIDTHSQTLDKLCELLIK